VSKQWRWNWRRLKAYFKGDNKMRKHILALGDDVSIQQTLSKAFGSKVDVMYDNGSQPITSLVKDMPPDVILADIKLFREGSLRKQIKGNHQVADVPLLLLANEAEMIPDDQLINWGVVGIINRPLNVEELKLRVGNFLDTYASDDLQDISFDEFRFDNLDEELRKLNQRQESESNEATFKHGDIGPDNDTYTSELKQILAEIDEAPAIQRKEEPVMKAEKHLEDSSIMDSLQTNDDEDEPDEMMDVKPFSQNSVNLASVSDGGAIERWFRAIAEDKIAQVIAKADFSEIIERVAREVVPQLADELVTKEIERIKKKIIEE
jgi:DNA-binding response OmpR family regulator